MKARTILGQVVEIQILAVAVVEPIQVYMVQLVVMEVEQGIQAFVVVAELGIQKFVVVEQGIQEFVVAEVEQGIQAYMGLEGVVVDMEEPFQACMDLVGVGVGVVVDMDGPFQACMDLVGVVVDMNIEEPFQEYLSLIVGREPVLIHTHQMLTVDLFQVVVELAHARINLRLVRVLRRTYFHNCSGLKVKEIKAYV